MDTTINTSQPHTTWSASPAASHVTQTSPHVDDVTRVQSTATQPPVSDGIAVPAPDQSDPGETVAAWIKELASSGHRFDESMRRLLGEAWTSEAADKIRELITSGEMKQILATPADREVPTPGVESPMNATQTIADGVGARLAATVGVSVSPEASRAFGAELDPARQGELSHYLTHVPEQEPSAPVLFETAGLEYTSNPVGTNGFVSIEGIEKDYIAGWIGTPPEIAEMDDAGIANMLSPEWRTAVVKAARQNGGLGNSTDGFLAFSRDVGFVRLRNPRLSPEQNRRLAEMSLTMGVSIDTLPSRAHESSFTRDNIDHWVNEIIGRYDEQIEQFRNDPTDAVEVKDGSKRYVMKLHEESGRVISYDYKKHGGVKGFAQKHMDIIGPVLDVASIVVNFVPGLGQGAAIGIQGLKTGLSAAAYGKLTAGHVAGLAGTVLPGLAQSGVLSATQAGAINGALNAGAQYIDTGSFDAASLVSALSPSLIHGLPGGPAVDRIVQNGLEMTADAIVHGRIDPSDALSLVNALYGAVNSGSDAAGTGSGIDSALDILRNDIISGTGIDASLADIIEGVAPVVFDSIARGELSGVDVARILGSFAGSITDDTAAQDLIQAALLTVGGSVDQGTVSPRAVHQSLIPALRAFFAPTPPARAA